MEKKEQIIYDFYYSEDHEIHLQDCYKALGKRHHENFINGNRYTEMVEHGRTPVTSHFKDLKKVFTGDLSTLVVKRY